MLLSWLRVLFPACRGCTERICGVSDQTGVEVTPRWMLSCRMVGNHWYSDSEAANGSVADGVFVREENGSSGASMPFSLSALLAGSDLLPLTQIPQHMINYLTPIVYQACRKGFKCQFFLGDCMCNHETVVSCWFIMRKKHVTTFIAPM